MRPIRLTGVTGNSQAVPLDVYVLGTAGAIVECIAGTQQIQYTLDDPFVIAAGSLAWTNVPGGTGINTALSVPNGARAIRCQNMAPADVLVVSQQSVL